MLPTLAIVERLPGHTEDMGGFAALSRELGYNPHLFFEPHDPFHMIDYYRTRLCMGPGQIHDWSHITQLGVDFDVILLNTSFVWLDCGPLLQQWHAAKRLVVVHHHPEDVELNPYGVSAYLTPACGYEKWIFPLYSKPHIPEVAEGENDLLSLRGAAELPTLVSIGTFEGKDIAGAIEYMKAGGKLVHYDRHRCYHFTACEGLYTQYVGLNGLQFMSSLAEQGEPFLLWLPIVSPSDYLVCRFTAALIIGVEMDCLMVMPEPLRALYGFPQDAVITYSTSITEPECLKKLRASPGTKRAWQKQLRVWARERWRKNLMVFQTLLDSLSLDKTG